MPSRVKPEKLLSIWEDNWGKLSPEWSTNFLNDPRIKEITAYPVLSILSAVQQNKKLDHILSSLKNSSNQVQDKAEVDNQSSVKPNPKNRKPLGTYTELKAIFEWLIRMNSAQFDPESTFPRLIIKSDKETCLSKRKYKTEQEAILTLIKLEETKGELIKQLPYRCNICREFHNTHLISRETIQKLLRKYNQSQT